jgi:hypothetical protein
VSPDFPGAAQYNMSLGRKKIRFSFGLAVEDEGQPRSEYATSPLFVTLLHKAIAVQVSHTTMLNKTRKAKYKKVLEISPFDFLNLARMENKIVRLVSDFNKEPKLKGVNVFQIERDGNATRMYSRKAFL